jgi:hypothetical protein
VSEFFGTSLRRDPGQQPPDLMARIDLQLRERLEEAVDLVGIDTIVQVHRARGLQAPERDNPRDFDEYTASVKAFLELLAADLRTGVPSTVLDRVDAAARAAGNDHVRAHLAGQVVLAKELPDYWQRFERVRLAYTEERAGSGGERVSLLARIFGRG